MKIHPVVVTDEGKELPKGPPAFEVPAAKITLRGRNSEGQEFVTDFQNVSMKLDTVSTGQINGVWQTHPDNGYAGGSADPGYLRTVIQDIVVSPNSNPVTFPPPQQPYMQPLVATDVTQWPPSRCADWHTLREDLIEFSGDGSIVGACERCGVRVFLPRIAGEFSFEKAGAFVARAMSLDEDDDESAGALLLEAVELQKQIDKDIKRFKRAMEVLQIAKNIAKKRVIKIAEPVG